MMAFDFVVALSKSPAPALVMTLPFDRMAMVRDDSDMSMC